MSNIFIPRTSILEPTDMRISSWWYSNDNPFYTPSLSLPNCTCYAYGRYAEARGAWQHNLPTGNAGTWYETAVDRGFNVGSTPALGAIACYYDPNGNHAGHVAIVEIIQQQQGGGIRVTTSNSSYGQNHDGTYWWSEEVYPENYYTPTWALSQNLVFQGFIYNDIVPITVSTEVIAAICGCWWGESGLNPKIWESLIPCSWDYQYDSQYAQGGYGLGQWTNVGTSQGRLWNLHSYVNSPYNFFGDGNGYGQLNFFIEENYWTYSGTGSPRLNYTTLPDFLNSTSSNIDDLVYDFLACWEGVEGNRYEERRAKANVFYNYILQHLADDPRIYQWKAKNDYLTEDETYNNLMVIYFWLRDNYQNTPTTNGKRMPLWMMLDYTSDIYYT